MNFLERNGLQTAQTHFKDIFQNNIHRDYMDLEPQEALAIRWHMGAYDDAAKADSRAMSAAMAASPWVWRLQEADMCAAWIDEREAGE